MIDLSAILYFTEISITLRWSLFHFPSDQLNDIVKYAKSVSSYLETLP